MSAADVILAQALALDPRERAKLVLRLSESLDATSDEDVESAWAAVVARRVEAVRDGSAEVVPAVAAIADARARLAARRG